jgi:FkbM family methyltransferase
MRKRKNSGDARIALKPVKTMIPSAEPIELVAYYPEFRSDYPTCELQTKRWLVENARDNWVSIDAGANVGYHSILLGRKSPSGRVFAFEPTSTAAMLKENIAHNGVENIEVVQKALGNELGIRREQVYRIWGESAEEDEYDFTTIDAFVRERDLKVLHFIKIDVDGFNLEILFGATETLARFSPIVLVEVNHALATRGFTASEIYDFMLKNKYGRVLILDKDNYVFFKDWELGEPWPSRLELSFDHRQCDAADDLEFLWEQSRPVEVQLSIANGAKSPEPRYFHSDDPPWHYVVTAGLENCTDAEAVGIQVDLQGGSLGVFVSDTTGSNLLTPEITINRPGRSETRFVLPAREGKILVFRKTTAERLEFSIEAVQQGPVAVRQTLQPLLNEFGTRELEELTGYGAAETWNPKPLGMVIPILIDDLIRMLGRADLTPSADSSAPHDPADHLMERDDAPVLAQIFRAVKPAKHLEIGTWEGFGATLCARNCEAQIWTVNLPEGEVTDDGARYTSSREPFHPANPFRGGKSDDLVTTGWMYREAGFSNRVTQLFGDSARMTPADFGQDSFDTVFIDGGHERDIVLSDQRNALQLTGRDGIIMWHDFSLNPEVVKKQPASRGVVTAVSDDIDRLSNDYSLFWVKDSMVMVAVPRNRALG